MSPRVPPRRRRPISVEEFVRREEELARQRELEERPFDPEVPPERYAEPHHFAVNGLPRYVVEYSAPGVYLVAYGATTEDALDQIKEVLAGWGEEFDESDILGSQEIERGVFFGIGGDAAPLRG